VWAERSVTTRVKCRKDRDLNGYTTNSENGIRKPQLIIAKTQKIRIKFPGEKFFSSQMPNISCKTIYEEIQENSRSHRVYR
jgi:glutamine amidotransferase-like uncharacterized protein